MGRLTVVNNRNPLNKFQCAELDLTCEGHDCDICNHMHEMVDKLGQYEDICDNPEELKEAWEKSQGEQPNFSGDDWHECPTCYGVIRLNVDYENGIRKVKKPRYCCNCGQRFEWEDE